MKLHLTTSIAIVTVTLTVSAQGTFKPVALAGGDRDDLAGMTAERAAQAEAKAYRDSIEEDPLVYRHQDFERPFHSPYHRNPRFTN